MTTTNNDETLYRGKTKTVWENGRQIQVPDYNLLDDNAVVAASNAAASSSPYTYKKTLEDVITSSDKFQYDRLKTDTEPLFEIWLQELIQTLIHSMTMKSVGVEHMLKEKKIYDLNKNCHNLPFLFLT